MSILAPSWIRPIQIGNVTVHNNLFMAPLAGVTDVAFRYLATQFGAGLCYTEMISAKALSYGNTKTKDLLDIADNQTVSAVQLFGREPEIFARVVQSEYLQKFSIIDINMGCPVPKIVKNGEGSALMKDPKLAEKIIRACVQYANKPITVKLRLGQDLNRENFLTFAKTCQDSGAQLITLHARTVQQMYAGKAEWDKISQLCRAVQIPVAGNGDIFCAADAQAMIESTGCAAVMIARGAMGRPWIFSEIQNRAHTVSRRTIILQQMQLLERYYGDKYTVLNMRKHIGWYCKGLKCGAKLRQRVNEAETLDEIYAIADEISEE